jgi:hypothetical protein
LPWWPTCPELPEDQLFNGLEHMPLESKFEPAMGIWARIGGKQTVPVRLPCAYRINPHGTRPEMAAIQVTLI